MEIVRLTQGAYIKPPNGAWYTEDMPEEHKTFVQEWNPKVVHEEDTSQVNFPLGITILPPQNKWAQKARRLAEQAKHTCDSITAKKDNGKTDKRGNIPIWKQKN